MRGRHRGPGLSKPARVAIVAVVLLAAAGGLAVWRSGEAAGCSRSEHLTVNAAPEIATVLAQSAAAWAATASANGECVSVDVQAAAPADVALAIASGSSVDVPGLTDPASPAPSASAAATDTAPTTTPATTSPAPDVWVPDSSIWLTRVRAVAPSLVPLDAVSIATSPVVLAVPEPIARGLGWPDTRQNWNTILGLMTTPGLNLNLGVVEPSRDAVGLTSLIALATAAQTLPNAGAVRVEVARALIKGRVPAEADLLAGFPKADDPQTLNSSLVAAPLAERSLIGYNATSPAVKLAALYVQPLPPALDYPWAVMPGASKEKAQLAEELRASLTGEAYVSGLASAGLRDAEGTAGFAPMPGAPASIEAQPAAAEAVSQAVGTWLSLTRPGRLLAVVDVSGSMGVRVPSAGNQRRYELLIGAARRGLSLFDDAWEVGLWTFSTDMGNGLDYQEWLPIRPLTENRPGLEAALDQIRPKPNGDTGLYDTMLAAYKKVQEGWNPGMVNSVVLMTDGQNDDDHGITLDELTSALKTLVDPRYPIRVVIIGIGDEVSEPELKAITAVTGGGVFIARDPNDIDQIFLESLADRPPTQT